MRISTGRLFGFSTAMMMFNLLCLDAMAADTHSLPVSLSFVTSGTKLEV